MIFWAQTGENEYPTELLSNYILTFCENQPK